MSLWLNKLIHFQFISNQFKAQRHLVASKIEPSGVCMNPKPWGGYMYWLLWRQQKEMEGIERLWREKRHIGGNIDTLEGIARNLRKLRDIGGNIETLEGIQRHWREQRDIGGNRETFVEIERHKREQREIGGNREKLEEIERNWRNRETLEETERNWREQWEIRGNREKFERKERNWRGQREIGGIEKKQSYRGKLEEIQKSYMKERVFGGNTGNWREQRDQSEK